MMLEMVEPAVSYTQIIQAALIPALLVLLCVVDAPFIFMPNEFSLESSPSVKLMTDEAKK